MWNKINPFTNFLITPHHDTIDIRLHMLLFDIHNTEKRINIDLVNKELFQSDYLLNNINQFLRAMTYVTLLSKNEKFLISFLNNLNLFIDTAIDYMDNNDTNKYTKSYFQLIHSNTIYHFFNHISNLKYYKNFYRLHVSIILSLKTYHKSLIRYLIRNYRKQYLNYILNTCYEMSNKWDLNIPYYWGKCFLNQKQINFLINNCEYLYQLQKLTRLDLSSQNKEKLDQLIDLKKAKKFLYRGSKNGGT